MTSVAQHKKRHIQHNHAQAIHTDTVERKLREAQQAVREQVQYIALLERAVHQQEGLNIDLAQENAKLRNRPTWTGVGATALAAAALTALILLM